jgi:hypothetical protein
MFHSCCELQVALRAAAGRWNVVIEYSWSAKVEYSVVEVEGGKGGCVAGSL